MARNDGDPAHRVADLFGVAMPAGTGAMGTPGAVEADALPDSAFRVPVSIPGATSQGDIPMVGVGWDDVNQPGQSNSYGRRPDALTGIGDAAGLTGAGMGTVGNNSRHPDSANRP